MLTPGGKPDVSGLPLERAGQPVRHGGAAWLIGALSTGRIVLFEVALGVEEIRNALVEHHNPSMRSKAEYMPS